MDAQRFNMPRRTVPLDPNPVDLDITDCDSVTSSFFSSEDDIISSSTSFEDITDTLNQSTFDEPSAPPPSASASAFLFSSPSLGALDSSLIMEELEEVAAIRARQNVMDSQRFDMSKSKNKNFQPVVIEPETDSDEEDLVEVDLSDSRDYLVRSDSRDNIALAVLKGGVSKVKGYLKKSP